MYIYGSCTLQFMGSFTESSLEKRQLFVFSKFESVVHQFFQTYARNKIHPSATLTNSCAKPVNYISTVSDNRLSGTLIERFSNDRRETNIKAITPTNQNRSKLRDEQMRIASNYL